VQICRRRTGADSGGSSAVEVVIVPTAVTGAGEGIYPWDLKPQSTMTNPTVSYSFKDIDGRAGAASSAFDGYSRPYLPGEIVEPLPTRA
jgi:hypothetical protein